MMYKLLEPSASQALPFQITWQFIFTATIAGMLLGAWTGGILGAAVRLAMPRYQKVDTIQQAGQGDLMLAVQADDTGRAASARTVMQENGAVGFEEFKETWDPEIWSVFDEDAPRVR